MSSQSILTNRSSRRIAAALGASAALSLTLVAPALASQPWDVSGSQLSSAASDTGSGSTSSAERSLPAPQPAVAPKLVLRTDEPTNVPAIGAGVAAAVVIAGGLLMVSSNRRRTA